MFFTQFEALFWIEKLIAIAIIFQTLEFYLLRDTVKDDGVWSWHLVKGEFEFLPKPVKWFFNVVLKHPQFNLVLFLRLFSAAIVLFVSTPHPICFYSLLLTTMLVSLRWLGTFNGGSDFMTIFILVALSVATTFKNHPSIVTACLWYIAIQVCTSYFLAGFGKVRKQNWRTGVALPGFLNSTIYNNPSLIRRIFDSSAASLALSWLIIIFECSFPLVLANPRTCAVFLGIALLFHSANFYLFGLNRFVFVWSAAYPALLFCSR